MSTRVAVIGVGALGKHHARILAAMPDVELVGDRRHQRGTREGDWRPGERAPFTQRGRCARPGRRGDRGGADRVALERRAAVSAARNRRAGGEAARAQRRRGAADDRCGRGVRRRVRRRPHRALQPGGRGRAAAARSSALHRGAPAGHVSRSQPRHRRGVRPDDSRPRRRAVDRAVRGGGGRGGRRRRADAEARHRERAAEVRVRVHREHHGEPHQQGSRPQDPDFSARCVSVGRLRGPGSRAMAAREGQRRDAGDRRRQAGDRAGRAAEARAGRLRRRRARQARARRDRRGRFARDRPRASA